MIGELFWFLSGVNLVLLSFDRLQRKQGKAGQEWVRRWCPEAGAILFILGAVAKFFGL